MGIIEVDTPVLQGETGGADARPFITHHNSLGRDLCLKIATELHLKRMLVPNQPGSTECGYYVCKFMKEIIDNGLDVLVTHNIGNGKLQYTNDDLDEVREDWAAYVSNFV